MFFILIFLKTKTELGELTARASVIALKEIMLKYTDTPQVVEVGGITAGHSMGGHGAFMRTVLNPDDSVCSSITSGYIYSYILINSNIHTLVYTYTHTYTYSYIHVLILTHTCTCSC